MAARGEGTGASTAADIRAGFFLECEDLLAESTDALDALKAPGATRAALDALFRAVHSIKGGAAAFGLSDLTDFAHGMETQLATYRAAGALPTPGAVAGLERLADRLARLVALAREGTALSEEERLADAALLSQSEARDAQRAVQLTLPPSATDGKSTLRALETLGRVDAKPDPGTLPDLASFDPAQPKLGFQITLWTELSPALVQTALQDLDPEGCLKAQQDEGARAPAPAPPSAPTIRVDLGRIDKLINLVGELVINQAMLARSAETLGARPNSDHMLGLEELMRLTRDLQSNVMQIRAQPIKPLFQRMARICREAAAAAGKRVTLAMEGSETEIDKTVLERLADPLTHMIRNAVDHAIEPEEARRAAGKPAEGQITLSASHRSGQVILQVSDDGAGIDRAKVRARAEAAGLIAPGAALSTADIDELLFAPGLSTAAGVSALSGRGVGMDVVRAAILSLGGRISIESRPGAGTRFEIALPLTLAVLDAMTVAVADETLVIPLSTIHETLTVRGADVFEAAPGERLLRHGGRALALCDLGAELGYHPPRADLDGRIALITGAESAAPLALIIDDIHEQRQVVIKGLQEGFAAASCVAAATILGDGRIALIIDPYDASLAPAGRSAGHRAAVPLELQI